MKTSIVFAVLSLTAVGCAARPPAPPVAPEAAAPSVEVAAPQEAPAPTPSPVAAEAEPALLDIPTTCTTSGDYCLPDGEFVKRLCTATYPDVALSLFAKDKPFSRMYLRGDVEAWNASGGRTHKMRLAFDEEVLVLRRRSAEGKGGIMMVGASATYDVLRWDGSCVSVMEGEITKAKPPAAKRPTIPWTRLEERTKDALLASPRIKAMQTRMVKECAQPGPKAQAACEKADAAFTAAIADFVRTNGGLPTPSRRP